VIGSPFITPAATAPGDSAYVSIGIRKKTAIAEFFAEKFVVSTFQGFGNKRLSWGVIPSDKTLPPIVISSGAWRKLQAI